MFLVYGHEAKMSKRALPEAYLMVDIMAEWPDKTKCLKDAVDQYRGSILTKYLICLPGRLCELCHRYKDRRNIHNFLETIYERFKRLKFKTQLELIRFLDQHGSALFERNGPVTHLHSHCRLKKGINSDLF